MLAGLITFHWYRIVNRLSSPVLVFDDAWLALFAVSGAGKALAFDAGPVCGDAARHADRNRRRHDARCACEGNPTALRTELYAVATLIGAAVMVIGRMLHVPSYAAASAGAVLGFEVRFMAIRHGWQLPLARPFEESSAKTTVDRSEGR
jgi:uncharacterized membrane protein YeiH